MSLILADRHTCDAGNKAVLIRRVKYISDPHHRDHKNKKIRPARNYNIPGGDQSPEAFISEVVRLDDEYHRCRLGKVGKRSRRLFEEIIYSSLPGANLTEDERATVEAMMIDGICRMAVCRPAWHIDERTGREDLHILLSAKNLAYPPQMTLWSVFGGSNGDHLYACMDALDSEIAHYLNLSPDRQTAKLKSAKKRYKENAFAVIGKQQPLADELALYFYKRKKPIEEIEGEAIAKALKSLGHEAGRLTDRSVTVQFKGRKKRRRYNLPDLNDRVLTELERLLENPENPGDLG